MRLKRPTWVLAGALFASSLTSLHAQNARLYVGNSVADTISVIDLNSLKLVGELKAGPHVHGLAVQADGTRLFTTSELDNSLRILDPATGKLLSQIGLTGRPNQCAVTPDGKYVAVPIRDGDSVDIVDVAKAK